MGDCDECGDLDVALVRVADPSGGSPILMCDDCAGWWLNHAPDAEVEG
jgi:hypothetical protein